MSKRNPRMLVLLSCGHWTYWHADATNGDARMCRQCREISTCRQAWATEWHAVCVGGCSWGAWARRDEQEAYRLASHHAHLTRVVEDSVEPAFRKVLPYVAPDDMLPLFVNADAVDDPPPF